MTKIVKIRGYGNLNNRVLEVPKVFRRPVVGDKATITMWSDRIAVEVIDVNKSGKTIRVRAMLSRPLHEGMTDSQHWVHTSDDTQATYDFKYHTKRGTWKEVNGTSKLIIGVWDHYYDYNF